MKSKNEETKNGVTQYIIGGMVSSPTVTASSLSSALKVVVPTFGSEATFLAAFTTVIVTSRA